MLVGRWAGPGRAFCTYKEGADEDERAVPTVHGIARGGAWPPLPDPMGARPQARGAAPLPPPDQAEKLI